MDKFSKELIDTWRENFTQREYPKREANLDGRVIDYFVMPTSLFQGIPNGLFRMTGNPGDGYIIGVSDEVPVPIQNPFAVSEHDEFIVYGLDDMDKTLHSEQNMLRILNNPDLRNSYIKNKLVLYSYMVENARGNLDKWHFSEEDYAGFVRAHNYLTCELKKDL
ncbi:MAG: hypothetical protein AABX03_00905 [Nanoarchaeota archaeon]